MLDIVCFAPGTPLIFLFQLINGITMINDKQLIFLVTFANSHWSISSSDGKRQKKAQVRFYFYFFCNYSDGSWFVQ